MCIWGGAIPYAPSVANKEYLLNNDSVVTEFLSQNPGPAAPSPPLQPGVLESKGAGKLQILVSIFILLYAFCYFFHVLSNYLGV